MTNGAGPPHEAWAVFSGDINAVNVQRIFQQFTGAMAGGVTDVHLLFQTWGGFAGDGVCLYNFFRSLPISLTLYNVGSVASAGVIAYLGAKERKSSTYASFMIHRVQVAPQLANADRLKAVTDSLVLDDQRTEAILRQHVSLMDEQWAVHSYGDLYLSAEQAVKSGLATAIGEFSPPFGSKLFQV